MNGQQIIDMINLYGAQKLSYIIKDLINDNVPKIHKIRTNYDKYLGDVEIKKRKFDDINKINNSLPNDYRGDIIDGIVGYMFGVPISYVVNEANYSQQDYNKIKDELNKFIIKNNVADLDSTTGEMMSICGIAMRLLYVDNEGQERVMPINPWEAMVVNDATTDQIQYALIYYDVEVIEGNKKVIRTKAEWYDNKYVYYFISNDKGDFVLDDNYQNNPQLHLFDYVPVIKFQNNDHEIGDFQKVDDLINAYDKLVSDIQNDIEEFRLAYLAFYGVEPTPEVMRTARITGAFKLPEGTDCKFITKPLDSAVEFIKDHKKTLNDNIYKFAKAIDMTDEKFSGGAMSGESRKWKLVGLENKAVKKERKFIKALTYQFKVLASAWKKKGLKFNYEDLSYIFTRNIPVDLQYHANATRSLKGMVSDKTRLSLLPFVKDPDEELAKIHKEYEESGLINFDEEKKNG